MDVYKLDEKFRIWQNIKFYFPYSELTTQPQWRVAILTCMDCRIITSVFGIEEPGNAIIIRTAGALLTFDSLRSLLIAIYELNVNVIVVVGHTDCGAEMTKEYMTRLLARISKKTGISGEKVLNLLSSSDSADAFLGFNDVEVQIHQTVKTIQEHPLISPAEVEVVGYIYDVSKGKLSKIQKKER
ncbi:MAG: carbonic anhydrase [Candidatus Heimdallarchaeota archaeon]|nr:MAG: carbonic anhydrase [Candidatus Heimdallarchaeota archaeon]